MLTDVVNKLEIFSHKVDVWGFYVSKIDYMNYLGEHRKIENLGKEESHKKMTYKIVCGKYNTDSRTLFYSGVLDSTFENDLQFSADGIPVKNFR